ncbi:hypothetical protein OFO93_39405, partial [Escherichia coli]|nr:hypothetical protein [Escherichia coli]
RTSRYDPELSPADVSEQRLAPGPAIPRRNGFEARLVNVGAVRLRTDWMGIDPSRPLRASLRGDGRTTLILDRYSARSARLDG